MKTKVISFSLIFVLVLSSLSSSFSEPILPQYNEEKSLVSVAETPSLTQLTKDYTLSLEEKKTQITNQEVTVTLVRQPQIDHITNLKISESIIMSNSDQAGNQLYILKHDRYQAIMERIFNHRKSQFDKVVGLPSDTISTAQLYHSLVEQPDQLVEEEQVVDFDKFTSKIQDILSDDFNVDLLGVHPIITALTVQYSYDDFAKQLTVALESSEQQSST
ncbi:MAG: hypothetical protein ACK4TO_07735, partial [Candidatus Nitrosotenuis sp.]